jgi:hypothetical protein
MENIFYVPNHQPVMIQFLAKSTNVPCIFSQLPDEFPSLSTRVRVKKAGHSKQPGAGHGLVALCDLRNWATNMT